MRSLPVQYYQIRGMLDSRWEQLPRLGNTASSANTRIEERLSESASERFYLPDTGESVLFWVCPQVENAAYNLRHLREALSPIGEIGENLRKIGELNQTEKDDRRTSTVLQIMD